MSSPDNPQFDPQSLSGEPQAPAQFVVEPFRPPDIQPAAPAPNACENPVWGGWDLFVLACFSFLTVLFVQLLAVIGAHHFIFRRLSWAEVASKPAVVLLAQLIAYAIIALYMFFLVEGKYHAGFGQAIRWNWPGAAGVSFLGLGALMLSLDFLGHFLPMPKSTPFDQFFARPSDAYLLVAFAVTLGPLMEELFFRGFLYPVIARRIGAVPAILITGVLFGAVHSPQYGYSWAVLIIILVGVVLTTVRAMTKSVASSFLAHVGYNATLMILAAVATDGFRHMDKAGFLLF